MADEPLTDAELDRIIRRAELDDVDGAGGVLRLVAEVCRLRAQGQGRAWTDRPPAEPGLYWCWEPGHRVYMREMLRSDLGRADLSHCQWIGPLAKPAAPAWPKCPKMGH